VDGQALHVQALSFDGIARDGARCGSVASRSVRFSAPGAPITAEHRPSAATRTSSGPPSAPGCTASRQITNRFGSRRTRARRRNALASVWWDLIRLRARVCEPMAHSQPPDRARPSRSASACGAPGRSTRSANAKLRWRSPTVGLTAESSVSRSTVAVSSPASHRYPPSVRIAERLTWFPLRTVGPLNRSST
jgi:hypothetical protein